MVAMDWMDCDGLNGGMDGCKDKAVISITRCLHFSNFCDSLFRCYLLALF